MRSWKAWTPILVCPRSKVTTLELHAHSLYLSALQSWHIEYLYVISLCLVETAGPCTVVFVAGSAARRRRHRIGCYANCHEMCPASLRTAILKRVNERRVVSGAIPIISSINRAAAGGSRGSFLTETSSSSLARALQKVGGWIDGCEFH
jgi:hypothetical protein